ncbi:MAG: leucine-rich repeat domain-containing protein [Faecalicoccus sp.]|nr:leucine-rich repeat domain-containing protein [Faecalicoccus sp.]
MKNLINNSNTISIDWNLDEYGCLTVKGSIPDFGGALMDEAPWKDEKDNITSIVVERGIEEIGRNAFRDCINLEKVFLPSTLKKIHSYAFKNCLKLVSIITDKSFQYVYDKHEYDADQTIIFGVEAFYNTPWIESKYPDFYSKDNQLFLAHTHCKDLVIPEGIKVLKSFCLSYMELDSLILPSTLEEIEDFAFFKTTVKKPVVLPKSVSKLADGALNTGFMIWDEQPELLDLVESVSNAAKDKSRCYPELFKQYGITSQKLKGMEYMKQIKVVRKKPSLNKASVLFNNTVDVSGYLRLRRKDKWLINMIYNEDSVIELMHGYYYDSDDDWYRGFGIVPCLDEDGLLDWWIDTDFYEYEEDFAQEYGIQDGAALYRNHQLTSIESKYREEWFLADMNVSGLDNIWRQLITHWTCRYPEFRVYTEDELRERKGKVEKYVGLSIFARSR